MKTKRLMIIILFLLGLSCNSITNGFITLPTATLTRLTPTPTTTPLSAPAYIPPDCQNSAIATIPAATPIAEPATVGEINLPLTKDLQFRVFAELVGTINNYYLYPDFNGVDWKAIVERYRAKVEGGLGTEAFYAEMSNLVSELKDDHSQFESPSMVKASDEELSGRNEFVGIGVITQPLIDKGHLVVLAVYPDSSADHSGIKAHDSLLAVDGMPLVETGKSYIQRLRGPECSTLKLTVQSPGGELRDVVLMRYKITTPEPINAQLVSTTDGSHIGYIFIPTFFDETIPDQIKNALDHFGQLDGLILDNRMNGGGSSDVVDPILSYFTSGTVGQLISRAKNRPFIVQANPINNSQTIPLAVLVGEDTVSYGEIFSGILQDEGRAKIIGKNTLGKVETLHAYRFFDGSFVWIAQERFDPAHSHANWEKSGITPDIKAIADWDTFTFENDPFIKSALELFGHK